MKPVGKVGFGDADESSGFGLLMDVADMDPLDVGEHAGGGGHGGGSAEKLQDADFFNGAARAQRWGKYTSLFDPTKTKQAPSGFATSMTAATAAAAARSVSGGWRLALVFFFAALPRPRVRRD
jgi:hypothetical protein